MRRITTSFVLALAATLAVPAHRAWADDPPPSPADLAKAKKAFKEADALYKAGKLLAAIDKLKESYTLSRNAFLLYNIGHAYDELGKTAIALTFYQQFLGSAPADAPMRGDVQKRVEAIQAEQATEPEVTPDTPTPTGPPSKYSDADLHHTLIDSVPPAQPIDVTATVPDDAAWTVTLEYRRSGEDAYTTKPMTKRANGDLIARINRPKVAGHSIQYYIEAKDSTGNVVARSGKRMSPNVIYIEANVPPHFDTSVTDPADGAAMEVVPEQAPLRDDFGEHPAGPLPPFARAKWIATGGAAALIGFSFVSYLEAGHEHSLIHDDSVMCGTPPCQAYDPAYDGKIQTLGQRWDTVYKVTLVAGVVTAGVAGYLWYRNHKFIVVPTADSGSAGAVAVGRF